MAAAGSDDALRRASLILSLRSLGLTDKDALRALESVPREQFVPTSFRSDAHLNRLVPLPCGQTMEAPADIARILAALRLSQADRVLEIGTGSGYLTALLAKVARRVISVERFRTLHDTAQQALQDLRVPNADLLLGDGLNGWSAGAPYPVIVATGMVDALPPQWLAELAIPGRLMAPIGSAGMPGKWILFTREGQEDMKQTVVGPSYVAPLIPGTARTL